MRKANINFMLKVVMATVCMGSSFPTGKYLISYEKMPPFLLGGWRFMAAGLLMLALTFFIKGIRAIVPTSQHSIWREVLLTGTVGVLQTTGTMGFLNLALEKITSSMASIILFTNPLWLALFAHYLLRGCSKSPDHQSEKSQVDELQTGIQ